MRYLIYTTLLCLIIPFSVKGQEQSSIKFSVQNPRATVQSHLYFLQDESMDPAKAAQTLLAEDLEQAEKEALARKLKQIFDGSGIFIELADIPDNPNHIDSISGKARYILTSRFPELYVQRYDNKWLYSAKSVAAISHIHDEVFPAGANLFVKLTSIVGSWSFLGLRSWQWTGAILLLLLTLAVYFVFVRLLGWIVQKLIPRIFKDGLLEPGHLLPVTRPLAGLLAVIVFMRFSSGLLFPAEFMQYFHLGLKLLAGILGIITAYKLVDLLGVMASNLAARTTNSMDDQLVPLVRRLLKMLVVAFGVIFILQNLNVNVTALLAGVSIGGLALALAAQDTVKNFIGSISIFTDRPFQMGDFIETSGISGTVTEVGVRSTRLIDGSGASISIPNGVIANATITNSGTRTYRRLTTNLTVTYDTAPGVMETFVDAVRTIIQDHPLTVAEKTVVQFHQMSSSSLDIYLAMVFDTPAFDVHLKARQEVLLAIMEKAKELGVDFAFPTTTVHLEQ
ncbi:MAG: mechanosensitive ion channel family protein [Bacteroidia bacterium]